MTDIQNFMLTTCFIVTVVVVAIGWVIAIVDSIKGLIRILKGKNTDDEDCDDYSEVDVEGETETEELTVAHKSIEQ